MAIRVRKKKSEVKADAEHWITLHPNGKESKGSPALINGAGQIIGGEEPEGPTIDEDEGEEGSARPDSAGKKIRVRIAKKR